MAVDLARLQSENRTMLEHSKNALAHLLEIQRLLGAPLPKVLDGVKIDAKSKSALSGNAGKLHAHLIDFKSQALKLHDQGLIYLRDLK